MCYISLQTELQVYLRVILQPFYVGHVDCEITFTHLSSVKPNILHVSCFSLKYLLLTDSKSLMSKLKYNHFS